MVIHGPPSLVALHSGIREWSETLIVKDDAAWA
jgi:hypothetical protein